jgi:hypothetical protein
MKSMLDVRFNMKATVLNHYAATEPDEVVEQVTKSGHWETQQDDITGGIKRVWQEDAAIATPTKKRLGTDWRVDVNRFDIECYVRGFPEVGFRSSANTENFQDGKYGLFEIIQMNFPAKYVLNRRQFITNIRSRNDVVLWLEEETGQPTVFEVQGVTPTFDPFGRHIDNLTVLKRSDIQ